MRTTIALAACLSLLTSAAPPPVQNQTARTLPMPRPEPNSPVRCRMTDMANQAAGVAQRPSMRGKTSTYAPANVAAPPGPPPPPPPPPPPVSGSPVPVTESMARIPGVGVGAAPYGTPQNTERYDGRAVASVQQVATAPVSTFSVDVDTGAYANVRRFLKEGQPVPADAVRTEELINYFRYDYPRPADGATPFSITTDVATTPWNADTRLMRIGLRGYDLATDKRPPANLVFLVDTSGSMMGQDKLPLLKTALTGLADQLRPDDRVSIVAYAGSSGVVLDPTNNKNYVKAALNCLEAGGSTAGASGIALAYDTARATFRRGAVNRIFLATDGDFNVGISDNKELEAVIKKNRDDGITLTTLGFGQGNFNEAMMERIADVGNGNYAYIDSAMEAKKVLQDELSATLVTIAKDVKIQVEFNPAAVSEYRLIGYENRALAEEDFTNDAVDAGDIGAGHQVTALYEIVPAGARGWTPDRRYPANRATARPSGGTELAFVKLRYKMPDGRTSREISRPVPSALIASARQPQGDMAFAVAVAAYGQRLRGDKYLGSYSFADAGRLAGSPRDYWRQEFVQLAGLAGSRGGSAAGAD